MKLSNARNFVRVPGEYGLSSKYSADVDVTTGFWFWKKTVTRQVIRPKYHSYWVFADSGKFTPGYQMEEIEKVVFFENDWN